MPSDQFRRNTPGPRPITKSLPQHHFVAHLWTVLYLPGDAIRQHPYSLDHTNAAEHKQPDTVSPIDLSSAIDQHEGAIVGCRIHALARSAGDCQHRHRVRGEVAHPISQDQRSASVTCASTMRSTPVPTSGSISPTSTKPARRRSRPK